MTLTSMTKEHQELPNNLELNGIWQNILSLNDFAKLYCSDSSAIRYAIKNGRLIQGKHCMKYGKQWVIDAPAALVALHNRYGYTWYDYISCCKRDLATRNITPKEDPKTPQWDDLTSLADAADVMRLDPSTIRYAIKAGRLVEGQHCMKYGKQWVLHISAIFPMTGNYQSKWHW